MKSQGTTGLDVGDLGTLRYFGRRYRAEITAVGRSRVTVGFYVGPSRLRRRTVPVVWDRMKFEHANEGCFLPRKVALAAGGQKEAESVEPGLRFARIQGAEPPAVDGLVEVKACTIAPAEEGGYKIIDASTDWALRIDDTREPARFNGIDKARAYALEVGYNSIGYRTGHNFPTHAEDPHIPATGPDLIAEDRMDEARETAAEIAQDSREGRS